MAQAQYAHNHIVDPATGFLENPAYPNQFDATRKTVFLKVYFGNGLRLRRACEEIGISIETFNHAMRQDPAFKQAYDESMDQYMEDLEGVSRTNALNPRSVIERIFQLKCLIPEKYGQENRPQNTHITLNIDGKAVEMLSNRSQIIDAQVISNDSISDGNLLDANSIPDGNPANG